MKGMLKTFALAAAGLSLAASSAHAQFVVGAGSTFTLNGGSANGPNLLVGYEFKPASLPIGIRVEGQGHFIGGSDLRVLNGAANAFYTFGGSALKPYIIGGVGVYNLDPSVGASTTKLGINAGAGLNYSLKAVTLFGEARFTNIFTSGSSTQVLPITIGAKIGL